MIGDEDDELVAGETAPAGWGAATDGSNTPFIVGFGMDVGRAVGGVVYVRPLDDDSVPYGTVYEPPAPGAGAVNVGPTWVDLGYVASQDQQAREREQTRADLMRPGEPTTPEPLGPGWVELGYTTDDSLSYRQERAAEREQARAQRRVRRRAETATPPPAADTVAAIDAAVDAATDTTCACGCGRELNPDGPSEWFATQDCQRKWNGRQTAEPEEVYRREDANGFNIDPEAPGCRRVSQPTNPRELLQSHMDRVHQEARVRTRVLNWRRRCPDCGQRGEPENVDERQLASLDPAWVVRQEAHQRCQHCGYMWPGPFLTTEYMVNHTVEMGYVTLRMRAGDQVIGRTISVGLLESAPDMAAYIDREWDRLEYELLGGSEETRRLREQQMRDWQRQWANSYRFSMQLTDPRDLFRGGGIA